MDSKSSFLREVSVRARPSVQAQSPLRNCWGFFFALNRFGATWLTTLIQFGGYILVDTVVETNARVRHTTPQLEMFIYHSPLKPNNYEYPTLVLNYSMRKLLIILMVASLFGDTLVYKVESMRDRKPYTRNVEVDGNFEGIMHRIAYMRKSNGKLEEINCVDIISIFDDNRKPISWDCNENSFVPNTLNELDVKKLAKKPIIGGTLIAVGGLFLFNNLDKNCDDCETAKQVDDFLDEVKSTQKIGYIFIILGGIFVALGI